MKKILLILFLLCAFVLAKAQVPTDPTDLQAKINSWIVTNGNKQITATQIHDLLTGINNLMLKYSVNGAFRVNDTLFLTGPNLTTIKVTMSAGSGGGETDPTVPLVVKAITSTDISTWNSKQAALTPGSTIDITSNIITAKNTLPLWNSNQIQGHAVSSSNPTNGQIYIWNSGVNQFVPGIPSLNPGATLDSVLYNGDTAYQKQFIVSWNSRSAAYSAGFARRFFGIYPDSLTGFWGAGDIDGNGSSVGLFVSQKVFNIRADSGFQVAGSHNTTFTNIQNQAAQVTGPTVLRLKLPYTGNLYDTLATLFDVRNNGGGGGNPFADNNPLVKNNSDNTKRVIIGAANVTTSTTRTLQSPDASGTIVLNDNTATLTNKTIAAGSNTVTGLTNSNLSGSAAISNSNLSNSAITINGSSTSLGGSATVTDANLSTSNVTTNNVSTTKHGFVPIAPNIATQYLDGTGAWSTPAGGVSPDVVTPITSGTTSTVPNGTNIVVMNPGSITSAYSLTFPATPHSSNSLMVFFGGTVTSGTVITTLTSVANSGQTLNTVSATGTGTFGEPWVWKFYNNVWYRIQ